jgi:cell division inhibitor SepF
MVTAGDAYDEWHEDDERYGDPDPGRSSGSRDARRLELVRQARSAFKLVAPESFEVAQTVADSLRAGHPVVIDLHGCDPRLAGRLTDFCSGLVYALEGSMQHVGADVVLLAPDHLEVTGDEASAIREPGFLNRI